MKKMLVMLGICLSLFGLSTLAAASEKDQAVALVNEAAKAVAAGKDAGLQAIQAGKYVKGEIYVFAYDLNAVMLAHGRPSHAYDLAKLKDAVVARRAKPGETVVALNGKEYSLTSDMTVIADATGVHDIAGIMGGEHSGVAEGTTDILLDVCGQALKVTIDAGEGPSALHRPLAVIQ